MRNTLQLILTTLTGFFLVILTFTNSANGNSQHTANNKDTIQVKLLLEQAKLHIFSDLKKTQKFALEAIKISESSGYQRGISLGNYYLAQVYLNYNFQLAESYLIESLKYAKVIADSAQINRINNSFGVLYQNANEYEKALKYFHKVLNSYLSKGNDSLAAAIYNNLGISYEELDFDRLALNNYLLAVQINERNGNMEWLSRNYQNLGNYYIKQNKPLEAQQYLAKSLEIAEKNNNESIKPYVYYNLYECALLDNNYTDAMKFARLSLQKSKQQLELTRESEAVKAIIALHEKYNRIDSAFIYQKALISITDSISNTNRIDQLYALDLQNELEEQKIVYEMQLKILSIQKTRSELIYIIAILLSLLLLIAAGYSVQWQRKRLRAKHKEYEVAIQDKGLLENQLDYKNKELTMQLIFLQKRNDYLNQMALRLKRIAGNDQGLTEKQLNRIINEIANNTEQDIWPEFEVRFKETHNDFYKNLTTRFPNLTPNELKLCAFLKLNMSTKEIADLTNQNSDSLKIARHRLRSKLSLSRSDNMVNFLNQL
jgi:tetratricopeptide (TPR) repeat protein